MLRVENLVKFYGEFQALKGVSFSVKKGEILGLIGENGAGKSTTIRILIGLLKPTAGIVEYDGLNFFLNRDKLKKKIGYVPEVDALYEDMKAKEYLEFFASLYDVKADKRIEKLMEMLKIPNKTISEFSKGMRRKLSIARSLIHDPDYLIYDEPIGGLDPMTSLFIAEFMKGLRDKAILFSAHNLYYVESVCDKVAIMKAGELLYYGDVEEIKGTKSYTLYYEENGEFKEFRTNDIDTLNEFIREIVPKARIVRIDVEARRLEDVYFELMKR
jgi:ABC-2 type transport system ATP-binding protein